MPLRAITPADREAVAEFLDARTLILRWLVAFFRNLDRLPEESRSYWSFWCDGAPALSRVVAHFFYTATSYVVCAQEGELGDIEGLCRAELLPERLVGDREVMERWRCSSPGFFEEASRWEELEVLAWGGEAALEPREAGRTEREHAFRLATGGDRGLLEEYERLASLESGDDVVSDYESLIAQGMVFVCDVGGQVAGLIRSNLSDGRYVHAGGLYVHPTFRGKGIGRALALGLARQVERASGAVAILDCARGNERALRAYRAAGYRTVGGGLEVRFPESAWR